MSAAMKRGNDVPPMEAHLSKVSTSSLQKNGSGPPSLNYITEPSDDENMNEIIGGKIDLNVLLPDGQSKAISIDSNIPMMDLLVNLAASSKLNPASHSLILHSENKKKPIEYKANQTIGSLNTDDGTILTVQLVPKRADSDKKGKSKDGNKPFEVTYRFTVNLPRSQKKILRISPNTTLEQVYLTVCEERHLDPSSYILEHPATGAPLINLRATVGDLRLSEVNFVNASVIDSTKSLPNLHRGGSVKNEHQDGPPGKGEKKKRGFFSFLRKDKKQKLYDIPVEPRETGKRRPASMAAADFDHLPNRRIEVSTTTANSRPKTMFVSSSDIEQATSAIVEKQKETPQTDNNVVKHEGKKRRAPPPPQKVPPTNVIQVEVNIEESSRSREPADHKINSVNTSRTSNEQLVQRLHSRNSSDSSGYHELTLSGPESPDTERIDENYDNFKTSLDSTSIESVHLNGDSGIRDVSPPRRKQAAVDTAQYKSQTLPLDKDRSKKNDNRSRTLDRAELKEKTAPSGKKKKAPPPPPEDDENTDKLLMEEDLSITAEEIETDLPKAPRPCSFIAPPPPNTPPPPDSVPVDYNEVVGSRAATVDIGVGEDTTSLHSHKSSPVSDNLSPNSMPEQPKDDTKDDRITDNSQTNKTDQTSDSGSLIIQNDEVLDAEIDIKTENIQQLDDAAQHIDEDEQNIMNTFASIIDSEKEVIEMNDNLFDNKDSVNHNEARNEISQITYTNESVEQVAAENQNGVQIDIPKDNEEEEYTESYEEVIISIPGPGSPRRIPDFDTPKEHSVVIQTSVTEQMTELDFPVNIEVEPKPELETEPEPLQFDPEIEEEHVEREKEEIIITLDDLHNVDFGGIKKPKTVIEEQTTNEYSDRTEVALYDYDDQYRPDVSVRPYKDYEPEGNDGSICGAHGSVRGFKGSVKNRCTEISFSPKTESEMENVLEEKSISMIALPAMRVKRVEDPPSYPTYSSSAKLIISSNTPDMTESKEDYSLYVSSNVPDESEFKYNNVSDSPVVSVPEFEQNVENGHDESELDQSQMEEQQETLRIQYEQLQDQMSQWQAQLEENQRLLESQTMDPVDREIQLQQIQMYRDMMFQLQQNIEALNIQQQQLKDQQALASPDRVVPDYSIDQPVVATVVHIEEEKVSKVSTVSNEPPPAPAPPVTYSHSRTEMKEPKRFSPTAMNSSLLLPKPFKAREEKPKNKAVRRFEPKLDPREELMIAIRNYGGWSGLKRVPVRETKWHNNR